MVHLVQISNGTSRCVGLVEEPRIRCLEGVESVYALVGASLHSAVSLSEYVRARATGDLLDYDAIYFGRSEWKLLCDKISGSRVERPGLAKAQEALREGDTLVVWKLGRLGRSVKNLWIWWECFTSRACSSKASQTPSIPERHPDASSSMSWPASLRWDANCSNRYERRTVPAQRSATLRYLGCRLLIRLRPHRKWGPRVNGVAADVSLDKTTYQLNEDVPLHLAVENFNAAGSVRAWEICLGRTEYGPICVCIYLDPKHMTLTKQASGLLSPADWANAVGQHLVTQSKQHNSNKVTAEFTVTPDARHGCHTICIYITIPPLCYSDC
jgi:Resolvase, N terminal domain